MIRNKFSRFFSRMHQITRVAADTFSCLNNAIKWTNNSGCNRSRCVCQLPKTRIIFLLLGRQKGETYGSVWGIWGIRARNAAYQILYSICRVIYILLTGRVIFAKTVHSIFISLPLSACCLGYIQTHSGHGKIAFCQDNFSLNWSRREDRIFLNCTKEYARYLIKAIALVWKLSFKGFFRHFQIM